MDRWRTTSSNLPFTKSLRSCHVDFRCPNKIWRICCKAPKVGWITTGIVLTNFWGGNVWAKSQGKSGHSCRLSGGCVGSEGMEVNVDTDRQPGNQHQTLTDCFCCHIYCAQLGAARSKISFCLSFFLGWWIPHLITRLSRWYTSDEPHRTHETVLLFLLNLYWEFLLSPGNRRGWDIIVKIQRDTRTKRFS